MKKHMPWQCACIMMVVMLNAHASSYGNYDPERIIVVSAASSVPRHSVDLVYLDQILSDLAAHAGSYPPHFDTPTEQQLAMQDIQRVSSMLEILTHTPRNKETSLCHLRAYQLNNPGDAQISRLIEAFSSGSLTINVQP